MREEVLRLEHVSYKSNDQLVLNNINMHIFSGEVMGLLPINDQGQHELLDILCNNRALYYGRIYYNGKLVNSFERPRQMNNRITLIERRSHLAEDLSVSDNIFTLRKGFKKYIINKRMLFEQLQLLTKELGVSIDGSELVRNLNTYERKVVELMKASIVGSKLIIVENISDELSQDELKHFHCLLQHYTANGCAVLYVSAHHEEAFEISDRLSIIENGQILRVLDQCDFSRRNMEPYYINEWREWAKRDVLKAGGPYCSLMISVVAQLIT